VDNGEGDRLERMLGAMQRVVREPAAHARLEDDAAGWLRSAGVHEADVEPTAIQGARRMLVYRTLVRRGLLSAIRTQLARTAARLGSSFDAWVERWIEEELPRSHYLRDVAGEFLAWAAPRWAEDQDLPRWMADLARHELALFEVGAAVGGGVAIGPIALDAPVVFDAAARLVRYAFAVQALDAREEARDVPPEVETALLIYRDAAHEVRCLSLSPLAAAIVERLLQGHALGASVTSACEALVHPLDAAVLEGTAALLADLAERGVFLGKRGERAP
jgi:hypothetical protein